jgi:pSer/pThr/pTyr-binding forkhead associated (FHA) protein
MMTTHPFPSADAPSMLGASAAAAAIGVRRAEGLPGDCALLVVTRGPNAGSRFLLNQPVTTAGRHPNNEIFLDEITVGRRHAEFRRDKDQFQVVDSDSLNGTYVNRKPVKSAILANGDEIQIGKFRLVFLTRQSPG